MLLVAREQVGKHIPATQVHATIGRHPLLGNEPETMQSWQQKTVVFCGVRAEELCVGTVRTHASF
jgi:hypothetical protein